jgi:hypothetical protein
VARVRWADAGTLLAARRFNGAIYLAGYAVECHLKHVVCERNAWLYLPVAYETHSWESLVRAARLTPDLRADGRIFDLYSSLVERWGPALRYRTMEYPSPAAERLYNEIGELYQYLREFSP